jgi:hypothetical protein
MNIMTEKGIRKEWCEQQRINYINFRDSREVENYIVYLENKIAALNIDSVVVPNDSEGTVLPITKYICGTCKQEMGNPLTGRCCLCKR